MFTELNEAIAKKGFCTLILDYKFDGYVGGRVLNDGYFCSHITADSMESFLEKFFNTSWR